MGKVINLFTKQEVSESEIQALALQATMRNLAKAARDLEATGHGTAAMFATESLECLREDMAGGKQQMAAEQEAVGQNPQVPFTEDDIPF